jgi:hypothetical protein
MPTYITYTHQKHAEYGRRAKLHGIEHKRSPEHDIPDLDNATTTGQIYAHTLTHKSKGAISKFVRTEQRHFLNDGWGNSPHYPHGLENSDYVRKADKDGKPIHEENIMADINEDETIQELENELETDETETGLEADESEEAVETGPTAQDALNALLDDNLLDFNEIMSDLITSRAADYVNATREVLAQNAFNLGAIEDDGEEVEDEDSELFDEDEEEIPNEE